MQKIHQILEYILGPSKNPYSSDCIQYQFNCICCSENNGGVVDNKFNLELNLQIQRFKCWSCCDTDGTQGSISKLIKQYGNTQLLQEYNQEINNIREYQLYDFNYLNNNGITPKIDITLPQSFKKIKDLNNAPYKVKKYLNFRKIDQKLIDKFNIGYTDWSDPISRYKSRIIFPSYDSNNKLNYWVGRDYTNGKRLKYMNSDADKTEIVFWENLINWDADIYLTEGIFDALPLNNAIPMLGKILKKDSFLFKTLIKKANANIIIMLDQDTDINETKQIYKILNTGKLKNKIKYCMLTLEKDISDIYKNYGKKGILNTLKNIKQFKEIELIYE